jgi:hypothetical protein
MIGVEDVEGRWNAWIAVSWCRDLKWYYQSAELPYMNCEMGEEMYTYFTT